MNIFTLFADNKNPSSKAAELRRKRFKQFVDLLRVDNNTKILDVGGTEAIWLNTGFEENITLLNINHPTKRLEKFTYVIGDACQMDSFDDNEFDVVFSNSVIEHVGDLNRQKMFASEVQRVGEKYWVQTPNRHFPIEPHFVFPLFQYLPGSMQLLVGLKWKYSHFKMSNSSEDKIIDEMNKLRLLNHNEMYMLFSDGLIIKEKYLGLTKSLIAIKN